MSENIEARFIDVVDNERAFQKLYKLSECVPYHGLEEDAVTDHVVVSAVVVPYSGPEVLILPALPDGAIADWLEMGGHRGNLDHSQAIAQMGWTEIFELEA